MRSYTIVWLGQLASLLGSAMTQLALGVWIYQRTGSTTQLAAILLAATVPAILIAPLAGAWVDRRDRRRALIAADSLEALSTAAVFAAVQWGGAHPALLYPAVAVGAVAQAVHWPALQALTVELVPADKLARANGLEQIASAISVLGGPLLGAAVLSAAGLGAVLAIDAVTFVLALVALAAIAPASRPVVPEPSAAARPWRDDIAEAIAFVRDRPDLRRLLGYGAAMGVTAALFSVIVTPLVLAFSTPEGLGLCYAVAGGGMVAGGIAVTARGVGRDEHRSMIGFRAITSLAVIVTGVRPELGLVVVGALLHASPLPAFHAAAAGLWQRSVPGAMHGRVFALRRATILAAAPIAYVAAGPLVDHVIDPAPLCIALGLVELAVAAWFARASLTVSPARAASSYLR